MLRRVPFPIIEPEHWGSHAKEAAKPQVAESPIADVFENRHPSDAEKKWAEKTLAPTLEKAPERPIGAPTGVNLDEHGHARFTTISGVPIRRLYTQADLPADWSEEQYLGYPGQPPYTRGIHATGYRGKLFTMRQFSGFASPEETNQRYKYLLEHGGSGLSVAFDLPTLMGYDSDHPASEGEVGKCGVAIDSLEDMEILFGGIDLEKTTVSMTINSPASVLWAMYLVVAEKQGADWKKISGTIQNDILKEYIAQKEYIYPPAPSMRLVIDTFEFGSKFTPRFNTISISGYHIREAGSTALQELAFTLYDGVEYVEWARRRGLDVDDFGPRLSFFFNAHNDFFEEIAKYRAARKIWYRVMKDRFGAKNQRTWLMRFHTQTAGVSLPGAAAHEQHCARGPAGAGGGSRRNAVAAHGFLRRGSRAAHRGSGAHRAAHPADHCLRIGSDADGRSPGRIVLRGKPNAANGKRRVRLFRQARRHGRHGQSHRARLSAERNCRSVLPIPARRRGPRESDRRRQRIRDRRRVAAHSLHRRERGPAANREAENPARPPLE